MDKLLYLLLTFALLSSCKESIGEPVIPEVHNNHLQQYVENSQNSLDYTVVETFEGNGWTEYRVKLISGNWLSNDQVVSNEWWHWVTIVIPEEVIHNESMMIIGGGTSDDTMPIIAEPAMVRAAIDTRSVIAHISNIPFQPIDFVGDDTGGTYEDEMIAFGWAEFLEGGAKDEDIIWLARLPMTRAVVKGMDVVQQVSIKAGKPVDSFVVTGASKRGWTTWTTAIADDRVIAIAPVVIDLLNVVPSFYHHWRAYGEWSPAINEYINEGIMEWMGSKEYGRLLQLVEPYSFKDQLTLPKFIVNATGDEFFLTDSWKFYWDDLLGDKYLQYVPNSNHGLNGTYIPASVIAFYDGIINEASIPKVDWKIEGNKVHVEVPAGLDYEIRKWEAINPEGRDFRVAVIDRTWVSTALSKNEDGKYTVEIVPPDQGYRAGLVEITINPGATYPFTITSGTVVQPNTYPFEPFSPISPRGTPVEVSQ